MARLIDAQQLSKQLGLDIATVRRHTRSGEFPFARNLGKPNGKPVWRYDTRALDRWLDTRRHDVA